MISNDKVVPPPAHRAYLGVLPTRSVGLCCGWPRRAQLLDELRSWPALKREGVEKGSHQDQMERETRGRAGLPLASTDLG